ncbi:hypothetical protein [Demequina sp.]|uniref:hypothetical protein n=1 Tax=Demequina sp. TaxID=2050685 RepID=UPI003D122B72
MTPTSTPERPTLPKPLRRDAIWTFALLGASALLWGTGVPTQFLVLLTGPATIGFAISALLNSRGVDAVAGIRIWLWIAIGMGGMILLGGFGLVLMKGPTEEYQACMDRAITQSAKRECETQYKEAQEELLKRYQNYGVTTG